ncbi:uncharacterized protein LOC117918294 isoform X1 [Vitis riparia]|uniref:uncharacterized protein LOC117918294 isoform X1 n=1 Tax=Vitis riparia TaxID=96939 RepID=UPI00155B3953|nr:uncharacterized protein LOC117918294 isoform X1 [Vitis riparia]XP_034690715.1 uncharacterized protein LOC117918294 isoform X1 [Vitis riparia]XP_034690716.1 uncharacterized protein LOC117918294 isoform X1 [Vitis riparia]XP_034690717.1 uncharacterized protein LOC117918294 isoform X1 [Vitis riparia]XP_034690718.1 uncharacterized protein LOC117918294 isoform X1 [Vitis riparia]XP_034690720.1 uncharacterized protein LOC117918294 isoform X1 [Vitis riparia]
MEKQSEWRLHGGHYLGEISALCLLHAPPLPHFSSLPYLLAGTGSQVLLYDLESVKILRSFHVLEGIRVHGIACRLVDCKEGSVLSVKIAVFGERRVKLFNLRIEMVPESQDEPQVCLELTLLHSLPKFSHWVLDVCFFKEDIATSSHCLVVGCSDNSVHLWDMLTSSSILEVRNPERCLLYSMRLWGDELQNLLVASGTIYNEIIVWKAVPQNCTPSLGSSVKDHINSSSSFCNGFNHYSQQYQALNICRLAGHEGSIFRLAWSSNGSKLVSVSDDRSARIWPIHAEREVSDNSGEIVDTGSAGPVLFGHNARIWDCCILDSLIVTAGEDCTCRVWGTDGNQLKMIKEHIGRGVWRCLYDPKFSLLVTAGFDSAIKVHQLQASLPKAPQEQVAEVKELIDRTEIFTVCIPNSSEHTGLMDSKSEYVRSLRFTCENSLYISTNRGYLYHAKLFDTGDVKWTELIHVSEEVPIVCMDLLSRNGPKLSSGVEDWIAVGDGKGNMTVTGIVSDLCPPKVGLTYTWSAGIERQLLGTFWCKSLGYRYIFTADPRGKLKLWRLCNPSQSASQNSAISNNVSLIAEFISSFNIRIMCLDASSEEEVLICGDLRGNLILYPLLRSILVGSSFGSEVKITPLTYFKGAHGISSVSGISIAGFVSNQIEIQSTGGDGCICYLEYRRDQQNLQFIGMKRVKELSLVQSVSSGADSVDDLTSSKYAIGFASTDFIIWNLITETKVVQVPCGGWRRPHSYYLGDVPEMRNCFAYVKDEIIYIHRFWIPESERKIFPQNLHIQFHGREMHSLCFVSRDSQVGLNGKHDLSSRSSWIATGCEDGTVRLTRYSPGVENWFSSQLLGEHVGGSAVRSICPVSKIHTIPADATNMPNVTHRQHATWDGREDPFLLISVGAKRVITSWVLRTSTIDNKGEASDDGVQDKTGKGFPSMSFQWLSTDMPTKYSGIRKKTEDLENIVGIKKASSVNIDAESRSLFPERKEMQLRTCIGDMYENDWRYLAVTAFLVKDPVSRITVCFIVVGCSDATLSLRALILPSRLWFDVALLVPQSSPVLALQHAIIPLFQPSEEKIQIGNAYIAISGSTDGSIAFWDLTESVENFMLRASTLHTENSIDCQKRPRTGRGSQGGRWWRSLGTTPKKKPSGGSVSMRVEEGTGVLNYVACGTSSKLNDPENTPTACSQAMFTASLESEVNIDDSSSEICEISPLHVLSSIHQSGVNCLHISDMNHCQSFNNGFLYYLLSGGDDQALHCLGFDLTLLPTSSESQIKAVNVENPTTKFEDIKNLNHCKQNKNYRIRFLYHDRVASAHNSAVKGIWTDGTWVFSTGLDQRVRCWYLGEHGKLIEQAHLVISVPEPEALDARACGRNHYQIAVAGRGMQMVEFSVSPDMDGRGADGFC